MSLDHGRARQPLAELILTINTTNFVSSILGRRVATMLVEKMAKHIATE